MISIRPFWIAPNNNFFVTLLTAAAVGMMLCGPTIAKDFRAKDPKRFWTAQERAGNCEDVMFARGGKTKPRRYSKKFDRKTAEKIRPIAPLAPVRSCAISRPGRVPKPIIDARGGEAPNLHYVTEVFLSPAIAQHRRAPSASTAAPLLSFLRSWAQSNALSRGLYPSNDSQRIDFHVQMLLPSIIIAFGDTAKYMNIDERIVVGRWISGLVTISEKTRFPDRQDNKAYLRDYTALLWGITTQDPKLIGKVEKSYREALTDMRPDGSLPVDSSREGAGLHYHNRATLMLVAIASVAKRNGLDWYGYRVNGRDLHDVAKWSASGIQKPGLNAQYAISCPGGGSLRNTISNPDISHRLRSGDGRSMMAWVPLYVAFSGNADVSRLARSVTPWSTSAVHEKTLGPLPCVLNVN